MFSEVAARSSRRDGAADAPARDGRGPRWEGGRGRRRRRRARLRIRQLAGLSQNPRRIREQNVFGGTESGYTALCATRPKSGAMTAAFDFSRRPGDGQPADPCGSRRQAALRESCPRALGRAGQSHRTRRLRRGSERGPRRRSRDPGRAIARNSSRNPLKTMDSAPGLRPLRQAVGAIRAVRAGSPDASSPAMLATRPETTAAGRPASRRPEYCSQPLENMDSAPGNAAPPTGGRGYPCGSGRLAGRVVSGEARQRGPTRRSRAAGVAGARKIWPQPLENMDSARPAFAAPPTGGRGYPCGSGRLAGRVVCGDARNEARDNGRRPPGRRGHPENCSQPLENIDFGARERGPSDRRSGLSVRFGRLAGRVVCGEARNEARQDGRGPPGRRGRP